MALRCVSPELLFLMKKEGSSCRRFPIILTLALTFVFGLTTYADEAGGLKSSEPKHVKIKSLGKDAPRNIHDQKKTDPAPFKVKKTRKSKSSPSDQKTGEINPKLNH